MKFQFNMPELIIMILLFFATGISIGLYFYAPKTTNYLLYAGITFLPGLTLLLKGRVKIK